ncbi:MAG: hypothetical protein ACK5MP_07085 [Nostocoides sp.]
MPELPVSVRLALWVTHAWQSGSPVEDAVAAATPDADDVNVDLGWLDGLAALGERCLLVALPGPGRTATLPGCTDEVRREALDARECAYAPTLGGMIIPRISTYGPTGDQGCRIDLVSVTADPVPAHRVDGLDARAADRRLRAAVAEVTQALDMSPGRPFDATLRADAESGGRAWALPRCLPARLAESLARAATVERIARVGVAHAASALTAAAADSRTTQLSRLRAEADSALAEIASVAALAISRSSPAARS